MYSGIFYLVYYYLPLYIDIFYPYYCSSFLPDIYYHYLKRRLLLYFVHVYYHAHEGFAAES